MILPLPRPPNIMRSDGNKIQILFYKNWVSSFDDTLKITICKSTVDIHSLKGTLRALHTGLPVAAW